MPGTIDDFGCSRPHIEPARLGEHAARCQACTAFTRCLPLREPRRYARRYTAMPAPLYPTTPARRRARAARRPQLEREVQAAGRCTTPAPDVDDDWFRRDGEQRGEWAVRRRDLIDHCRGCPVIAACAELALRYDSRGDLDPRRDLDPCDDHVRGGLTTYQFAQIRQHREHRPSIRDAVDADQAADQQRAAINKADKVLRRLALADTDDRNREAVHGRVREAADELAACRAVRRAANGWAAAA